MLICSVIANFALLELQFDGKYVLCAKSLNWGMKGSNSSIVWMFFSLYVFWETRQVYILWIMKE